MKVFIETSKFRIGWERFYPYWHIGKPKDNDDAKFEISLGCLFMVIWKNDNEE